jgi:uncharacterized membrane protein YfcA
MNYEYIAVIVALTFCAAGIVKGVTGMGLPTIVMGVLGSLLSPLTAATLLLVPSLVTNAWQLFRGNRLQALMRRLWIMMAMLSVGTFAGSTLLAGGNSKQTTVALGIALIAYASLTLFARQFNVTPKLEAWLSPIAGLMTGIVTGCTGINVIPAVPYLQALEMERDELVQALGLTFTVATVALGAALIWHRALPMAGLTWSALAVAPALAGLAIGQIVRERLSPIAFRRGFLTCLLLLGLNLALRPLF